MKQKFELLRIILVTAFANSCAQGTAVPASTAIPTIAPIPRLQPTQNAVLFSGPGNSGYTILADLPAGETVTPLGQFGDFVKIKTQGDQEVILTNEQMRAARLKNWTLRVPIDESPGDKVFPTIIGLGSDPSITGKDFYVYYVFTPNWFEGDAHGQAILARRKISCE